MTSRHTGSRYSQSSNVPPRPQRIRPFEATIFLLVFLLGVTVTIVMLFVAPGPMAIIPSALGALIGLYLAASLKVANEWDKAVVLRAGRFHKLAESGVFWVIPILDNIAAWVDHRINVSSFMAEETLTRDTVPVDVDAVMFWFVFDAKKATLEVSDYSAAVSWASQTALRDIIGKTLLSDMLAGRETIDKQLRILIDERTEPWGIAVQSVEIRDVKIPAPLQDAMSREAQAERERRARIILATAETEISGKFVEAASLYAGNPTALQLRAMNILYEGLKERGALVVVPSSIADSMNVGNLGGFLGLSRIDAAEAPEAKDPRQSPPGGTDTRTPGRS